MEVGTLPSEKSPSAKRDEYSQDNLNNHVLQRESLSTEASLWNFNWENWSSNSEKIYSLITLQGGMQKSNPTERTRRYISVRVSLEKLNICLFKSTFSVPIVFRRENWDNFDFSTKFAFQFATDSLLNSMKNHRRNIICA